MKGKVEIEEGTGTRMAESTYRKMRMALTKNDGGIIQALRNEWEKMKGTWEDLKWEEVIGERIEDEGPLEAWMDGSFKPREEGKGESAGCSITIYRGEETIYERKMRIPGQETSQRAEMMAAIMILAKISPKTKVKICPDSEHVINYATKWREAEGVNDREVTNIDLVGWMNKLLEERERMGTETEWEKVKAHTGIERNEKEDKAANEGRQLEAIAGLEWKLLPRDTIMVVDNGKPIFDIKKWIKEKARGR